MRKKMGMMSIQPGVDETATEATEEMFEAQEWANRLKTRSQTAKVMFNTKDIGHKT